MKRLPMTHFKAAYVCLAVLVTPLAACTTTQPYAEKVFGAGREIDIKVAVAAKKLHDYCTMAQLGLGALQAFVHDAKVQVVLAKARPEVAIYCSGPPPADVAQAVQAMIGIYGRLVEVQAKVGV